MTSEQPWNLDAEGKRLWDARDSSDCWNIADLQMDRQATCDYLNDLEAQLATATAALGQAQERIAYLERGLEIANDQWLENRNAYDAAEAQLATVTAALAEAERDAEMLARLVKVRPCRGEGCEVCDALAKHDRRTSLRKETETPAKGRGWQA